MRAWLPVFAMAIILQLACPAPAHATHTQAGFTATMTTGTGMMKGCYAGCRNSFGAADAPAPLEIGHLMVAPRLPAVPMDLPEPSSLLLLGSGLLITGLARRRPGSA
ncbi:PEP-CTERM sorting domain-containing protein [Roseomonas marmotae]|uniref:PEP-CTERM sorting domain-containing protein n=1 Tax=Roseomonas marmotae TaxID=2768161 RepID=A0ABS3KDP2_9PROT|nr:PEP-CTERM sorting domain-containing protein [Roseomonas marmotae]MBO1075578.1 PEP-CTERM sorting domain-containing protein [Roseomonas marmotae]QTI79442.1 PEP-CTERM sorting domain-containing protein [Roseomonas marmotae]